jgi:CTP:molybdopterin cytidylyltransferase MocA
MISAIVLAAGLSTRMGSPKALLDWHGQTLVSYQVDQLRSAGADEVIVVLGHRADEIHRTLRDAPCRVMVNSRYFVGRASSLRIGAKAVNRDTSSIVIINVDQPRPADFLRALIAAHDDTVAATRPTFEGRSGHPVVVSGRLRDELLDVNDETEGLRAVLRAHAGEIREIESGPASLTDLNTPAEYAAARQG